MLTVFWDFGSTDFTDPAEIDPTKTIEYYILHSSHFDVPVEGNILANTLNILHSLLELYITIN